MNERTTIRMRRCRSLIVLCALFVLISSGCVQPYDNDVIKYEEPETTDEYNVDLYSQNEPEIQSEPPAEEPEEIIEPVEEEPMMIKPIDSYEAYAFADGKLKGIKGNAFYPIDVMDTDDQKMNLTGFYKDGLSLFFCIEILDAVDSQSTTTNVYFKQTAQGMEEIQESEFNAPESVHVEMDETPFKIATTEYKGMIISRVSNGTLLNSYLKIDGYMKNSAGLWFSVSEEYGTLKKGLYFWANDDTASRRKGDYGRIW